MGGDSDEGGLVDGGDASDDGGDGAGVGGEDADVGEGGGVEGDGGDVVVVESGEVFV